MGCYFHWVKTQYFCHLFADRRTWKLNETYTFSLTNHWLQLLMGHHERIQQKTWIPWNLSFCYTDCNGQFTPKMKANAEPQFAFIFGVNWLWYCGVTASFGVFFHKENVTEWQFSWNSWLYCNMSIIMVKLHIYWS